MQELYAERDGLNALLLETGDPKERASIEKRIAELNAKFEPKAASKPKAAEAPPKKAKKRR
jgi:hypothetical protein